MMALAFQWREQLIVARARQAEAELQVERCSVARDHQGQIRALHDCERWSQAVRLLKALLDVAGVER